jgi:triacylglycerol lipase
MAELRGANPTTLHVVGHSLGGAIANLVAATLAEMRVAEVQLYTFGAPRTGLNGFSRSLTRAVGAGNVHRVYNISDVVPMVPLYPYLHAPSDADGCRVRTTGSMLSLDAHFMTSYTQGVANQEWSSLAEQSRGVESVLSVDHWLDLARQHINIPGSSVAFFAIGKALNALLRFARVTLGLAFLGAATLLDQVAALLYEVARLGSRLLEGLTELLRLALRFSGQPARNGEAISTAFIAWVIGMLMRPINALAGNAKYNFHR